MRRNFRTGTADDEQSNLLLKNHDVLGPMYSEAHNFPMGTALVICALGLSVQ